MPAQLLESVAMTWKGKLPVWVGVPARVGVVKVMPVGRVPLSVRVVVPMPPDSVKVTEG